MSKEAGRSRRHGTWAVAQTRSSARHLQTISSPFLFLGPAPGSEVSRAVKPTGRGPKEGFKETRNDQIRNPLKEAAASKVVFRRKLGRENRSSLPAKTRNKLRKPGGGGTDRHRPQGSGGAKRGAFSEVPLEGPRGVLQRTCQRA